MYRAFLILIVTALIASQPGRAREPEAAQTIETLKYNIQNKAPATYFALATELFRQGDKEEAAFWYYVGELRYRFLLLAKGKNSESSDEPAHFWFLSQSVGQSIYEHADRRSADLTRAIDRALAWDMEQPNGYTPKGEFKAEHETVRQELLGLRQRIKTDPSGFAVSGRKGLRGLLSW
jgi:hypothetical protein